MFIIDSSLNHVMGSRSSHLEAAYDCAAPDNIKSSKAVGANSHSNTSPPLTAQSAKQPPHLCSVSTFTEETINGLTDFGVTLNNSATHCEVESQPVQPAVTTIQSHIYSAREPIPLFSTTSSISNRIASDSETDSHRELLFPRTRTDNASCSFRTHVPGPRSYTGISKQYVAGPLSAVPRRHRTISERTCCRCCCCLAGFPLCARAELQRTNRLLLGKLQKIFEEELSECVCHCGCSRSRPTDLEYRNERSASCRRYGSSTSISIKGKQIIFLTIIATYKMK